MSKLRSTDNREMVKQTSKRYANIMEFEREFRKRKVMADYYRRITKKYWG